MTRLKALAVASVIAVVLIEAATAALQVFTPSVNILQAFDLEPSIGAGPGMMLIVIWFAAGLAGAAMASAMTGHRMWGWMAGLLLVLPAGLLMLVSGWPRGMIALAFVPLAGAVAGAAMTHRLVHADRDDHSKADMAGL